MKKGKGKRFGKGDGESVADSITSLAAAKAHEHFVK